jgi:signal transduction histidine kinase
MTKDDQDRQLRSAAMRNADAIFMARQRAERRNEAYLAEAQRLSHTGSFGWRLSTGEILWSEETFRIFQYDQTTTPTVELIVQRVHPEDAALVRQTVERASRDGKNFNFEHRLVMPDGSVKYVHVVAHALTDESGGIEFAGAVMDVSAAKRTEMLLTGEKRLLEMIAKGEPRALILDSLCRLYEQLAGGSLSSILLLDRDANSLRHGAAPSLPMAYVEAIDGVVIGPSVGSCGTAAYRAEPVIVSDIATDPLWADFRDLALTNGLRACWSRPILSSEGRVLGTFAIYYREPRSPTPQEHNVIEQIAHLASIAVERERAEQERAHLEQRLRQAEKMEAVGRLAGGIAHDFNNVLLGILGYGEMLFEETPADSPLRRYAKNVLAAANRGRALVEQILAYSRSQRGKRAPVDLAGVVAETLELVRGSLSADLRLEASAPDLPLVVMGDATQLHQVVMNLCSNAIQAMGEGGTVRVALEAAEVTADSALSHGALRPGGYACLTVEDSGSGMDEATLSRIFEPFFTTKEAGGGTGLGLSIVYAIVTDLGGSIDVKSAVKQGSTFAMYLPLAEGAFAAAVDLRESRGPVRVDSGHSQTNTASPAKLNSSP